MRRDIILSSLMTKISTMQNNLENILNHNLQIVKFANELKYGAPLKINIESKLYFLVSSEMIDQELFLEISQISNLRKLILSKERAEFLKLANSPIYIKDFGYENIEELILDKDLKQNYSFFEIDESYEILLNLCKFVEIIPSIILFEVDTENYNKYQISEVNLEILKKFKKNTKLKIVARANLKLTDISKSEIIIFREIMFGSEYYAIIIGDALADQNNVLIRLHSSCYTGDLLASLTCDCRDQLHSALKYMDKHEKGGILLYLLQEGRGIGLKNKINTYALQNNGLDTVEANHAIGFKDDERDFSPAAFILQKLGINSVKIMTNNPNKAKFLENYGIKISEIISHTIGTEHNHHISYMKTKAKKMGHILPHLFNSDQKEED